MVPGCMRDRVRLGAYERRVTGGADMVAVRRGLGELDVLSFKLEADASMLARGLAALMDKRLGAVGHAALWALHAVRERQRIRLEAGR